MGQTALPRSAMFLVQTQNSKINFVKTTDYPDSINSSGDVTVSNSDKDADGVEGDKVGDIIIGSDVKVPRT